MQGASSENLNCISAAKTESHCHLTTNGPPSLEVAGTDEPSLSACALSPLCNRACLRAPVSGFCLALSWLKRSKGSLVHPSLYLLPQA